MSITNALWKKLAPFSHITEFSYKPIAINDTEFIKWSQETSKEIYKYNTIGNKWNKWLTFPEDIDNTFVEAMVFDANHSKLYILCSRQFIEWDVKKEKHEIFNEVPWTPLTEGVFIKNQCHIIGGVGSLNNKHLIWNNQQKKLEEHEFQEFNSLNTLIFHRLLHLKSKNILLCLGGMSKVTQTSSPQMTDTIYSFNVQCSKWTKLPQTLPSPLCRFGCILSKNDEYILIFGGEVSSTKSSTSSVITDKIYVLNMKTMQFNESTIRCPETGIFRALNMNDPEKEKLVNLVCFGYIRNLWKLQEFKDLMFPPFCLIQIIRNYISSEMIHLFEEVNGSHWKIDIDQIISNSI